MGLLDDFRRSGILSRKEELELFEIVAEEIERGNVSRGLWLKSLSEAKGNKQVAEATYARLRVQILRDDQELLRQVLNARNTYDTEYERKVAEEWERIDRATRAPIDGRRDSGKSGWFSVFVLVFLMLAMFIVAIILDAQV